MEQTLTYQKTYSMDILDQAREGENSIVFFLAAELIYLKVPAHMTVVMIYPYDWNYTMTPWEYVTPTGQSPRAARPDRGMEHTGGGADFARTFQEEIIEPTLARLHHTYQHCYIAGYSLGGLMAAYLGTVLSCFHGVASVSGSFWYPKALEYMKEHPYQVRVQKVYYSLGDKEARTMHPQRCEVEDRTRELLAITRLQGIETTCLEMNEGGHFSNVSERIQKALAYLQNE